MKQCKTKWYLYNSVKKTDETRKIYFPLTSSAAPKMNIRKHLHTIQIYLFELRLCFFVFNQGQRSRLENTGVYHKSNFSVSKKRQCNCPSWSANARVQPWPQRIQRKIRCGRIWKYLIAIWSNVNNLIFYVRFLVNCGLIYPWCSIVNCFLRNNIHMIIYLQVFTF